MFATMEYVEHPFNTARFSQIKINFIFISLGYTKQQLFAFRINNHATDNIFDMFQIAEYIHVRTRVSFHSSEMPQNKLQLTIS